MNLILAPLLLGPLLASAQTLSIPLTTTSSGLHSIVSFTLADLNFKVVLDTGSGNLILPTTSCPLCLHKTLYPLPLQLTQPNTKQHMVMFASGSVLGAYVEEDEMCAPGSSVFGPTYVTYEWCTFDINFLGATQMTVESILSNTEFDGILGLGLAGMSIGEGYSMVDRWKEEGFKGFRFDMIQKKLYVVSNT